MNKEEETLLEHISLGHLISADAHNNSVLIVVGVCLGAPREYISRRWWGWSTTTTTTRTCLGWTNIDLDGHHHNFDHRVLILGHSHTLVVCVCVCAVDIFHFIFKFKICVDNLCVFLSWQAPSPSSSPSSSSASASHLCAHPLAQTRILLRLGTTEFVDNQRVHCLTQTLWPAFAWGAINLFLNKIYV